MFERHGQYADAPGRPLPGLGDPVVIVTDANFEALVVGGPTVIDFFVPWCGPCLQFAPTFDRAAAEHPDCLQFGRCDVDQNPRTAEQLNIMSIPTLLLFDGEGREINRLVGAIGPRQLDTFLSSIAPGPA